MFNVKVPGLDASWFWAVFFIAILITPVVPMVHFFYYSATVTLISMKPKMI